MYTRYLVIILGLCFLVSCKRSMQPYFEHIDLASSSTLFKETQGGITCKARLLTYEEVYDLCGTDLISQGYHPLYLELINNSPDAYYISARTLSAPLASDVLVKDKMYWSTSIIAWTSTIFAAFFCWPAIPLIIIPSTYMLSKKNTEVDHFMQEYSLKAHERSFYVFPQERMKKICFVYGWDPCAHFELGLVNDRTGAFIKFLVKI